MQDAVKKKPAGAFMYLLLALTVFLLIKFTFAGVTLLIALTAIGLSFTTQNPINGNRLKLVAGFFGLLCVLNIYTEVTRQPATTDTNSTQLSPAGDAAAKESSAREAAYFTLKTMNRKPDSALKPVQLANCMMAMDSAEKGSIDWTGARDQCRTALNQLNTID